MGMYTTMIADIPLKKETPKEVIEILKFILLDLNEKPDDWVIPSPYNEHPLFETRRWADLSYIMQDWSSYNEEDKSKLQELPDGSYTLHITTVMKDYDSEQEYLMQFLLPYINFPEDHVVYELGTQQYEEWDDPIKIYYEDKKVIFENNYVITENGGII